MVLTAARKATRGTWGRWEGEKGLSFPVITGTEDSSLALKKGKEDRVTHKLRTETQGTTSAETHEPGKAVK